MPRLSLFKPEKGQDYKFMDRQISEMFQVGGTDLYLHKYIGPTDPTDPTKTLGVAGIQDVVFLENRDRKYDPSIYKIRGIYNVQNIDFNLSQFGLFIDNDTLFMTVHINDFIKYIGRKPISGDVIELPHLRDEFALNDFFMALPRYYVIEDVGRASEGFSATWYPHLYRLKCKKIVDSQQFADILGQTAVDKNGDPLTDASGNPTGQTLKDLLSTYNTETALNNGVISEAEANAPKSGYETRQFYTLSVDTTGKSVLETVDDNTVDASLFSTNLNASTTETAPVRPGYTGYLVGDGFPTNGYDFGHGIQFPINPEKNDYFLRTDFLPNRLFKFDGARWVKQEDAVRMTMTNNDVRQTQKTSFINNDVYIYDTMVAYPVNGVTKYARDVVDLNEGDISFTTTIDYVVQAATALYLVLKLDTIEIAYVVADNELLIGNDNDKVMITLPEGVPCAGAWSVTLFNNREAQRQSLSKALKPKADL